MTTTRLACVGSLALTGVALGAPQLDLRAGEPEPPRQLSLGLESDVLPFVLRGAHLDVWAGLASWRVRAIAVTNTAPAFFTPAKFDNLHTTIFELEIDRFFGAHAAELSGPWVAAGGGVAHLTIDTRDMTGRAAITVFEVSAGVGWVVPLPARFYVDPWVGFAYELTPSAIEVGSQTWSPPRLGPVLGLKLGWRLR